jgi:hypothetical protein
MMVNAAIYVIVDPPTGARPAVVGSPAASCEVAAVVDEEAAQTPVTPG